MVKFVPNRGFELSSGGRTITTTSMSVSKLGAKLTEWQLYRYAKLLAKFHNSMAEIDGGWKFREPQEFSPAISSNNFADQRRQPFRKIVSLETWERFLSQGQFQLGTAEYYRSTENLLIADQNEGLHFVNLETPDREATFYGRTGDNCALFCGTRIARELISEAQKSRFGEVLLEVQDTEGFASQISQLVGARVFRVFDVHYSDAKTFRYFDTSTFLDEFMSRTNERGDLTDDSLGFLEQNFELIYEATFLPSLFMKPAEYYVAEQERRIAFEFSADLSSPVLRFHAPELLSYISVSRP